MYCGAAVAGGLLARFSEEILSLYPKEGYRVVPLLIILPLRIKFSP